MLCICIFCWPDANVNKPRNNYVTPLHLAATSGDLRIVKRLVENNARINALDADQTTPLHKATAYDNADVIEYLVQRYFSLSTYNNQFHFIYLNSIYLKPRFSFLHGRQRGRLLEFLFLQYCCLYYDFALLFIIY